MARLIHICLIAAILGLAPSASVATDTLPRLRVSSDGRSLETSDGASFFWMGDTAWFLPKLSIPDIDQYLSDAAQKGFNGALIELCYYYFEPTGDPPFLDGDTDRPNETYWDKVDWIVGRAGFYGIYTALAVMWGDDYPRVFGTDTKKAYRLGAWLGQRYGSHNNVLWIVSGEYSAINGYKANITASQRAYFDQMAQGIRDAGATQLMSIHPCGIPCSSSNDFQSAPWLDFHIIQSGHQSDNQGWGLLENDDVVARDYGLFPVRPTMDGEPAYEGHVDGWFTTQDVNGPRIGAEAVRRKAYWATFTGAFGHTYGHFSIEIMRIPGEHFPAFNLSRILTPFWKDALDAPGRVQMRYLRSLMESRPILGRMPDQSILTSNSGTGIDHVRAIRASDGSYAWVYIPTGGVATIDMARLAGPQVNARWYSPRDGTYTSIGQFENSGTQTFDAPGATVSGNDWILVLDSPDPVLRYFTLAAEALTSWIIPGGSGAVTTGYARIEDKGNTVPEGVAVFSYRQRGVLISEASVSAVRPTTSGRIFAEVDDRINTGIAIANPNDSAVTVAYIFTDSRGNDFGVGALTISGNSRISRFLSEIPFSSGRILGTFTFQSSLPVAVTALRGLTNERGEFLITTLPVSGLTAPVTEMMFPHFVNGEGWSTQVVLVNPTDEVMSGSVHFYDEGTPADAVQPMPVTIEGDTRSSFPFSIPPRTAQRLMVDEESTLHVGSIRVAPDGPWGPTGVAIFEYKSPAGITTSEIGIAAGGSDRRLRLYAESNGSKLRTAIAITNTLSFDVRADFELFNLEGMRVATGSLLLRGNAHWAKFLNEIPGFGSVPQSFRGVLRVTGDSVGLSAVGFRVSQNERQDIVTAMIPVVTESDSASGTERFFPNFVNGGGYTTQFVLFNGQDRFASGTLRFFAP